MSVGRHHDYYRDDNTETSELINVCNEDCIFSLVPEAAALGARSPRRSPLNRSATSPTFATAVAHTHR